MKKIAALLICITMLFACTLYAAAVSPTTTCIASTTHVEVGKTFTVTVKLENCPKLQYIGIVPEYDSGVFKLVSAEWLIKNSVISDFNMAKEEGVLALSGESNCNGDIMKFTFQAKATSIFDDISISAKVYAKSADHKDLSVTAEKTQMKVIATQTQETTTTKNETTTTRPGDTTKRPDTTTQPSDTTKPSEITDVQSPETNGNTNETMENGGNTSQTTGPKETNKAPDNAGDETVEGDITGSDTNKALVIIIAVIIGLIAISALLYMRFKDNM